MFDPLNGTYSDAKAPANPPFLNALPVPATLPATCRIAAVETFPVTIAASLAAS